MLEKIKQRISKNNSKEGRLSGITLFETLLYLALFGVMFLIISELSIVLLESNAIAAHLNRIDQDAIFLAGHMNDNFLSSSSISSTNSVFDDDDGVLYLNSNLGGFYKYEIRNERIFYTSDVIGTAYLTGDNVKVQSYNIQEILNEDDELIGVRITLVMSSHFKEQITKTFDLSFSLFS